MGMGAISTTELEPAPAERVSAAEPVAGPSSRPQEQGGPLPQAAAPATPDHRNRAPPAAYLHNSHVSAVRVSSGSNSSNNNNKDSGSSCSSSSRKNGDNGNSDSHACAVGENPPVVYIAPPIPCDDRAELHHPVVAFVRRSAPPSLKSSPAPSSSSASASACNFAPGGRQAGRCEQVTESVQVGPHDITRGGSSGSCSTSTPPARSPPVGTADRVPALTMGGVGPSCGGEASAGSSAGAISALAGTRVSVATADGCARGAHCSSISAEEAAPALALTPALSSSSTSSSSSSSGSGTGSEEGVSPARLSATTGPVQESAAAEAVLGVSLTAVEGAGVREHFQRRTAPAPSRPQPQSHSERDRELARLRSELAAAERRHKALCEAYAAEAAQREGVIRRQGAALGALRGQCVTLQSRTRVLLAHVQGLLPAGAQPTMPPPPGGGEVEADALPEATEAEGVAQPMSGGPAVQAPGPEAAGRAAGGCAACASWQGVVERVAGLTFSPGSSSHPPAGPGLRARQEAAAVGVRSSEAALQPSRCGCGAGGSTSGQPDVPCRTPRRLGPPANGEVVPARSSACSRGPTPGIRPSSYGSAPHRTPDRTAVAPTLHRTPSLRTAVRPLDPLGGVDADQAGSVEATATMAGGCSRPPAPSEIRNHLLALALAAGR